MAAYGSEIYGRLTQRRNVTPRKLSISRKGFDSKYGGYPSPIFPDGTMYSLPIPGGDDEVPVHYGDLNHGDINIGEVVRDLTRGRLEESSLAGLDPDLRPTAIPRFDGWRAMLGQMGNPQSHLENQGFNVGDLFLFFGLFRQVERTREGWRFVRHAPKQHVLWGWLQAGQVCKVDDIRNDEQFHWATYHCHFSFPFDHRNTLYMAAEELDLGNDLKVPGAGEFPQYRERLALTETGRSPSAWRLPRWFYPTGGRAPLSCHPRNLWRQDESYTYVQRTAPGQEFVLDLHEYPEALNWISSSVQDFGTK